MPAWPRAPQRAIELLHCGSLVHDDLPCFDNAAIRRGLPSVHQQFGEPLAVLAGDGLIVLAVQTLVRSAVHSPHLGELVLLLTEAAGMPGGLIAGQAWESEPKVPLVAYQKAKTASLFTLATMSGALAAGMPAEPWRLLGDRLGEAYQIADDLRDIAMTADELGKPAGQDAALGRPSAAAQHGMVGAIDKVEGLVRGAIAAVPPCRDPGLLKTLILAEMGRAAAEGAGTARRRMRMVASRLPLSLTAWARDRIARLQATDGFRRAAGAFPLTPAPWRGDRRGRSSTSAPASSTHRFCWRPSGCGWRSG